MTRRLQGPGAAMAQIDPQKIGWARAAAQRLAACGFDAAITPLHSDDPAPWYRSEYLAFAPLSEPPLKGAPADALIATLSAHEDMIAEIEQALGIAAEFADYAPLGEDLPVITLRRGGAALARIAVLTPLDPLPAPPPPALVRLTCMAARLPLADAERLAGGDMVVLTHGPWALSAQDGSALSTPTLPPLGYDPVSGTIAPILTNSAPSSSGASFAMPPAETSAGLTVPVAVHLADIAITQAGLARLAETGTFDLGAVTEGLVAALSIGGRPIGQGEIVRLGDRFAVLLDTAETHAPPAAAGDMAEADLSAPTAGEAV